MASPVDKIIYYSLYAIGEGPYTLFVCSRRHLERFVCSLNLSLALAVRGPRYCSTGGHIADKTTESQSESRMETMADISSPLCTWLRCLWVTWKNFFFLLNNFCRGEKEKKLRMRIQNLPSACVQDKGDNLGNSITRLTALADDISDAWVPWAGRVWFVVGQWPTSSILTSWRGSQGW